MRGLDATERGVMEILASYAAGNPCHQDSCGAASSAFSISQQEAVWKLVARGLAVATSCDCLPGMKHIGITHSGLLILNVAKTSEDTGP
jgi:hypothetical protein